jgi:hypothetical protein
MHLSQTLNQKWPFLNKKSQRNPLVSHRSRQANMVRPMYKLALSRPCPRTHHYYHQYRHHHTSTHPLSLRDSDDHFDKRCQHDPTTARVALAALVVALCAFATTVDAAGVNITPRRCQPTTRRLSTQGRWTRCSRPTTPRITPSLATPHSFL